MWGKLLPDLIVQSDRNVSFVIESRSIWRLCLFSFQELQGLDLTEKSIGD